LTIDDGVSESTTTAEIQYVAASQVSNPNPVTHVLDQPSPGICWRTPGDDFWVILVEPRWNDKH
jgi:hypothetical protein